MVFLRYVKYFCNQLGRRRKLIHSPKDRLVSNWDSREELRDIFAKHIKDTRAATKHFHLTTQEMLNTTLGGDRKKRQVKYALKNQCHIKIDQLIEHELSVESLAAASILLRHWNRNNMSTAASINASYEREDKEVQKTLESLGGSAMLMAKHSKKWIKFLFSRRHDFNLHID